jgi:hypothetical protein
MCKYLRSGAAVLSLLFASGCLIESTIDANGGATMEVSHRVKKDFDVSGQANKKLSEYVEVTKVWRDDDGIGHTLLKVKDITKVSTAKMFRDAVVTRTVDAEKGTTTILVKVKRDKAANVPDEVKKYFGDQVKFVTTVPGETTETNATSKDGKTATWVFTMDEFYATTEVSLNLTYKNPG